MKSELWERMSLARGIEEKPGPSSANVVRLLVADINGSLRVVAQKRGDSEGLAGSLPAESKVGGATSN